MRSRRSCNARRQGDCRLAFPVCKKTRAPLSRSARVSFKRWLVLAATGLALAGAAFATAVGALAGCRRHSREGHGHDRQHRKQEFFHGDFLRKGFVPVIFRQQRGRKPMPGGAQARGGGTGGRDVRSAASSSAGRGAGTNRSASFKGVTVCGISAAVVVVCGRHSAGQGQLVWHLAPSSWQQAEEQCSGGTGAAGAASGAKAKAAPAATMTASFMQTT